MAFANRREAGIALVHKLQAFKGASDVVVVAIPRGGIVLGKVLADKLYLPLSLVIVRKLGAPTNPELAIGAIAPSNVRVIDWDSVKMMRIDKDYIEREIRSERRELNRRKRFQHSKRKISLSGKTVIITDDGIATGATFEAALLYLRTKKPKKIILAVPVAPTDTLSRLKAIVDDTIVLEKPSQFSAVGQFYDCFPQVTDKEIIKIMKTLKHKTVEF